MNTLISRDLKHIWHPCTQMKELETDPPFIVRSAQGSYIETVDGPVIDAISSWWCKSLGHRHPAIIRAIQQQLDQFEHVISANTTHPNLVALGEKLAQISKKQHVFFASDGSSAVEIAMKLAIHSKQIQGKLHQSQFIALKNSYHGETLGTLSVSDLGLYKKPYQGYGVNCHFLQNIPYVADTNDPLWVDASSYWPLALKQLEPIKEHCCALIIEPLIQGANGMLCYSADYLRRLVQWAQQHKIIVIADEIMTGIGRTGRWMASEHANISPDLICLSKGITSGSLPLSCVLIDHEIYQLFYHDYDANKSFLHSHTYSANPLAVAAALATLNTMEAENTLANAIQIGHHMSQYMHDIAISTQKLTNVRSLGAMVAADFIDMNHRKTSKDFERIALQNGALLRLLGRTLYWLPPLNTDKKTIEKLAEITLNSIKQL